MTLAIRAARLLPDSASELIHDGVVVVEGDRVKLVGAWAALRENVANTPVKQLGDVTLMPGLFDCHVGHILLFSFPLLALNDSQAHL